MNAEVLEKRVFISIVLPDIFIISPGFLLSRDFLKIARTSILPLEGPRNTQSSRSIRVPFVQFHRKFHQGATCSEGQNPHDFSHCVLTVATFYHKGLGLSYTTIVDRVLYDDSSHTTFSNDLTFVAIFYETVAFF